VNQRAIVLWTAEAWNVWMREHGGSVINIASIGGIHVDIGAIGYYNTTKAAVLHLSKQLANELAPKVRVNAIAPGLVKTDFARALWEPNEAATASMIPMGRIGEPDDIAGAAVFLASDAASWITGQNLVVDGGALLR
jgi:NAD(P)-dependent dehydrogenase (short-subunit alcohol dehydrogenase family)